MRLPVLLLLLAVAARAGDFGRTLRELKVDDRERRREALGQLADGSVRPSGASEERRMARALEGFLSAKRPGAERALAVRALGRLHRDEVYERLLDHLGEETDDRVLAAAAPAFRSAPAPLADELARRIEDAKDPVARAVLVRVLGELPGEEARRRIRLRAAIADHWCPRSAAVHALVHDRTPESYALLFALLDEDEPAVKTAAVESLGYLTGKDFGLDVAAWKAWWRTRDEAQAIDEALADGEGEGGAGAPKEDERRYAHELPARTIRPYYFGIPVRGSTVAFVFDVSASMRYKLPLAYDQLTRAVCGLPSTSRFEVIFFNEQVWPWRGRLSHADPVTKALLVAHLPEIKIRSYTNLFDSIEQALELEVEEIFVISDGEPNRGRRQLPRDILSEVKRLNTHGTRIHTVSIVRVVDGDDHVRLLAKIAEENGGEHVERTLK